MQASDIIMPFLITTFVIGLLKIKLHKQDFVNLSTI